MPGCGIKGLVSIAVSIGLILAVTAILWRLTLTTESSHALVYTTPAAARGMTSRRPILRRTTAAGSGVPSFEKGPDS